MVKEMIWVHANHHFMQLRKDKSWILISYGATCFVAMHKLLSLWSIEQSYPGTVINEKNLLSYDLGNLVSNYSQHMLVWVLLVWVFYFKS